QSCETRSPAFRGLRMRCFRLRRQGRSQAPAFAAARCCFNAPQALENGGAAGLCPNVRFFRYGAAVLVDGDEDRRAQEKGGVRPWRSRGEANAAARSCNMFTATSALASP